MVVVSEVETTVVNVVVVLEVGVVLVVVVELVLVDTVKTPPTNRKLDAKSSDCEPFFPVTVIRYIPGVAPVFTVKALDTKPPDIAHEGDAGVVLSVGVPEVTVHTVSFPLNPLPEIATELPGVIAFGVIVI